MTNKPKNNKKSVDLSKGDNMINKIKKLFWSRDKSTIIFMDKILQNIKESLRLQKTAFKYKDYNEAELVNKEILDWLKELGL